MCTLVCGGTRCRRGAEGRRRARARAREKKKRGWWRSRFRPLCLRRRRRPAFYRRRECYRSCAAAASPVRFRTIVAIAASRDRTHNNIQPTSEHVHTRTHELLSSCPRPPSCALRPSPWPSCFHRARLCPSPRALLARSLCVRTRLLFAACAFPRLVEGAGRLVVDNAAFARGGKERRDRARPGAQVQVHTYVRYTRARAHTRRTRDTTCVRDVAAALDTHGIAGERRRRRARARARGRGRR